MNDESEGSGRGLFDVSSRYLAGETEKYHVKPRSMKFGYRLMLYVK
jgi:hypothetical protein